MLHLLQEHWLRPASARQVAMLREIADRRATERGNGWSLVSAVVWPAIVEGRDPLTALREWDDAAKADGMARARRQEATRQAAPPPAARGGPPARLGDVAAGLLGGAGR